MSSNNLNFLLGGSWPKVDSSKPIGITNNGGPSPSRTWFRGSLNCSTLQGFGEEEINMRRKAEALQHRQNQKGMTKAQRWAYAVKHKSTIINPTCPPPHLKLSNNVLSCDNQVNPSSNNICERLICSSSSASDVPGPDTTLYLDPTVPFLPLRTNPRQTNAGSLNIPVNTVDLSKDQDCSPGTIPTVHHPQLVQLYCGSNDETSINMPPIYDNSTPPLDFFGLYVGIRNWFRVAQQKTGYGPQYGQFIICTSSDTKGLINAGESAFENMPAQLQKRMPNEDISNHFRSADNIVANIRYKYTYYSTVKNYLTMDNWFETVPTPNNQFGKPDSAITVLWWSFYTHWDSPIGNPIQGFTPGIDKTGFKLCWISNEALRALTCTAFTPIIPVYQNPSRIELCPPSSSSNCITEPQAMGNLQPKDLASLKIDKTPIYLSVPPA